MPSPTFPITVIDPDQTLFSGPVVALTSYNASGKFDILALHANLITLIKQQLVLHLPNHTTKTFSIQTQGVLRCVDQQVDVYIGI